MRSSRLFTVLALILVSCAAVQAQAVCTWANGCLPQFSVSLYGAVGDGLTNNATVLGNAQAAAAAVGGAIYIPLGTFQTNNITLSVPVVFAPGASLLKPATGQTIVITSTVFADLSQHFVNALGGQGTVSFVGNTSITAFYPQWWGAKGDNSTNDIAPFRATIAAVNGLGGGTIEVPDATYVIQVGDVLTDTNYTTINTISKVLFNIRSDNVTIKLRPKAVLRIVATYVTQNAAGSSTTYKQHLFYFGTGSTTPVRNFTLTGGTITWETASPAVLVQVVDGTNGFEFMNGYIRDSLFEDVIIDGIPTGGLVSGYTDTNGNQLTDVIFRRVNVKNYGGSGHDNWLYVWGNTTFDQCRIVSTRQYQSHGLYWGSSKPNVKVLNTYFSGMGSDPALIGFKFGLQIYQTTGTAAIKDFTIQGCTFDGVGSPILLHHVGGGIVDNGKIINNVFRGVSTTTGSAIDGTAINNTEISGNTFVTYATPIINSATAGSNNKITRNYITGCKNAITLTVSDSDVSANYITNRAAGGNGLVVSGNRNTVNKNILWNAGFSGATGVSISGNNWAASENIIDNDNAVGYSAPLTIAGNNWTFSRNLINATGGLSTFAGIGSIFGNRFLAGSPAIASSEAGPIEFNGNYVATAVRFQGGAVSLTNNRFVGTNGLIESPYTTQNNGIVWGANNNIQYSNGGVKSGIDSIVFNYATPFTPFPAVFHSVVMTLTGPLTINAALNPGIGQEAEFVFTQDATGGRVVTWDASFKTNWTPDTSANKTNTIRFRYNGTSWMQIASATGL